MRCLLHFKLGMTEVVAIRRYGGVRHALAVLVGVVLVCQCSIFYMYAYSCSYAPRSSDIAAMKVAIVSDIHLLGKRRRSFLERAWVDWQVRVMMCFENFRSMLTCSCFPQIFMSMQSILWVHRPHVLLILGDQLDEGGYPTPQSDWDVSIILCRRRCSYWVSL